MAKGDDRYAAILRRMWDDEVFRAWEPPPVPNPQFLWVYLLSTPTAGSIPGVYRLSLAEVAERFRWDLQATIECLGKIIKAGRAEYDTGARLLFLPNALRANAPKNGNMVKSWRRQWRELPECALKDRAAEAFGTFLAGMGPTFADAWSEVVPSEKQRAKTKVETVSETVHETVPGTDAKQPPNNNETRSNPDDQMIRLSDSQTAREIQEPVRPPLPPPAATPSADPLADTPAGRERAAIEQAIAPVGDVCDRCGGAHALAKLLHAAIPARRPSVDAGEIARLACVQILGEIGDGKHKVGGLSNLVRAAFVRLYTNPTQAAVARGQTGFEPKGQAGFGVDASHELAEAQRLTARAEAERRDREQAERARAAQRRQGGEGAASELVAAVATGAIAMRPAFGRGAPGGES